MKILTVCMCVKSLQLYPTLCGPMDCSRQAPLSMRILQARILEWVAMPPPGDLPYPGIKPLSPESTCIANGCFTTNATGEVH